MITTLNIFPVTIQQIDLSNSPYLETVKTVISETTTRQHGMIDGVSSWGLTDFLDDGRLVDLKSQITELVCKYSQLISLPPLVLGNSWYNHQGIGDRVLEHRHGLSVVSGALYIECDSSSSGLDFHDPVEPQRQHECIPIDYLRFNVPIYPGLLVLFPSWLGHSTLPTKSPRTVVSFNTNYVK